MRQVVAVMFCLCGVMVWYGTIPDGTAVTTHLEIVWYHTIPYEYHTIVFRKFRHQRVDQIGKHSSTPTPK